jgi:hemoglobin-like flavoprotein
MLARVIELIFDLLGPDHYAGNFVRAEVVTHEGYGVPREIFPKFFDALLATLRELLGSDWTVEMDRSWTRLVGQLTEIAEQG